MHLKAFCYSACALLALTVQPAEAAENWVHTAREIDALWVMLCAFLVFSMQIGFLLFEAGMTRTKNSINVAVKNKLDLLVSVPIFLSLGFLVMFGVSAEGWVGLSYGDAAISRETPTGFAFLLYQAAFCATAATIFSGAVAERFSINAYVLTVAFIALLIYPIYGHWVWGGALNLDNQPVLATIGFYDFAGGTVVHSIGAWVALAGVIVVGPRIGRFSATGSKVYPLYSHSKVLAGTGMLFILIGWFGFNGGSTLAFNGDALAVIANTLVAAVSGGCFSTLFSYYRYRQISPDQVVYGILAGLVGVTAGADLVSFHGAVALGVGGAIVNALFGIWLARRKVDDVVGAVACHGFAGAWGTIALAFFAPVEALPLGDMWDQAGAQVIGVVAGFAWAFGLSYVWFVLLNKVVPLRVPEDHEIRGLNVSEHNASLGSDKLIDAMKELTAGEAELSKRINAEPGDDMHKLSELFNTFLAQLEQREIGRRHVDEIRQRQDEERRERDERDMAEQMARHEQERQIAEEISTFIQRAAEGDLGVRSDLAGKTGALLQIAEGVNRLIDSLSQSIGAIACSAGDIEATCSNLRGEADDLRTRSAGQIDSVQSVTFSLEEMAETASKNSRLAEDALVIAQETQDVSSDVASGVERIEDAIREIEKNAGDIAPVVELIESIAFQTNLLAVNAAVEAARAGDSGRGFAIVAQEVRDLATRTANFAVDIGKMVELALSSVQRGVDVVGDTSAQVSTIRTTADRVSNQINSIHSISVEQSDRLNSLHQAVRAISEVSTANAQLATRTSGSALSLSKEGERLLTHVNTFEGFVMQESEKQEKEDEDDDAKAVIQLF